MREKLKYIVCIFIAGIAFCTGINYYKLSESDIECFYGCFVFGILQLCQNEDIGKCILMGTLSVIRHYAFMISGIIPILLPVTFLTFFGLCFKMGVCTEIFISYLGFYGIFEIIILLLLFLCAAFCASLLCAKVFAAQIYYAKYKVRSIDFFKKSLIFLSAMIALDILCVVLCRYTGNHIYGFFNTFL